MTSSASKIVAVLDPGKEQRKASDPTISAWVNASAGSGKTTVLTERVMRLLLSGVRPEKILCLTYTRAGAAEMVERVAKTLSKWAVCDDAELYKDLDKLQGNAPTPKQILEARRLFAHVLSCPGGLRIRTIHSFCQEILSRFPIEAGLPPYFSLIEEQELEVLKNEVLDDLLREAANHPEENLAKALSVLVAAQGETGFGRMLKEVTHERGRLIKALNQAKSLEALVGRTRRLLQLEPDDTPENIRQDAMDRLSEAIVRQLARVLSEGTKKHQERGKEITEILRLPKKERGEKFNLYCLLFLTKEGEPRKTFFNKELLQKHPEINDVFLNEALRLRSALERVEAAEIAKTTECVLSFGFAFAERLAERKAARAGLDYDDLILHTENLLGQSGIAPWILYKLDKGLDHILLDEAQDTSDAQWNIVRLLTEEFFAGEGSRENNNRTLFVVGDEKQSIFSFQNADPKAFLDLRDFFERRLKDAEKRLEIIPMHVSFRSAPAILNAVDAVFAPETVRNGVSPELIKHTSTKNPDGSEKIGRVEVWPLTERPEKKESDDGEWLMPTTREEDKDPQAELADAIASKIKDWLMHHEVLPGDNRPIVPDDIMILLRHRGRFADLMVRALKTNGVPVTGVDRMELVKQLPVMDLLALVRFVLLPEDDLNLACLLRSPLLGLSEEQLMELAAGRKGSLWNSVKSSRSFASIYDYLSAKLNEADFSTPFAFLSQILIASCPGNPNSGRKALWTRLGDEALDPIEELLNKAQSFGQNHVPSLQNFLHWLTQTDVEIKRELDRGEGQVRILTVHASKGLEAPIVFLPDTTSIPRDIPKFQWSEDGALLFLTHTPKFPTALALRQAAQTKQMEEYRRLLYVAMTRASRQLYICGWQSGRNEGKSGNAWYELASSALRPMHQDDLLLDEKGVMPDIAFADKAIPAPLSSPEKKTEEKKAPLPSWIFKHFEEQPSFISVAPTYGADTKTSTPDAAFTRGRIIHRLLQSLPDIAPDKRAGAVDRFLAHPRHDLTKHQRNEITREVHRLLDDERFAVLFASHSLAEAPLTGRLKGVNVFRQVDRLCQKDNEVWIVDYKTNRPPPENERDIPVAYRQQLEEYRVLLRGIYPDKTVRCFLLWTYAPMLMEISPA